MDLLNHGHIRQKANREVLELMDVMKQMDLTYIYRMFYPNTHTKIPFSLYLMALSLN